MKPITDSSNCMWISRRDRAGYISAQSTLSPSSGVTAPMSHVPKPLMRTRRLASLIAAFASLGALTSAPVIASNTYKTSLLTPPVHPVAGFDNTANLQYALTNTIQSGDTLEFDQGGDFEFSMAGASSPMLFMTNKSNVTITASVSGVRLLLTNCDRSNVSGTYPNFLEISSCPGFALKGYNATSPITFDTQGASTPPGNSGLPFLQGIVVMIASSTSGPCFARLKVTDSAMFLPVGCNPTCWAWTY